MMANENDGNIEFIAVRHSLRPYNLRAAFAHHDAHQVINLYNG